MNKYVRLLSWCIVILCIVYCVKSIARNYSALPIIEWNATMIASIACLLPVSLLTGVIICEAWRILLSAALVTISYAQSLAILGIAQIGKYLPGNVFHYVGRVAIGAKQGISSTTIAVCVTIETVLLVITASLIIVTGVIADADIWPTLHTTIAGSSLRFLLLLLGSLFAVIAGLVFTKKMEFLRNYRNILEAKLLCKLVFLYFTIFVVYGCTVKLLTFILWGKVETIPFMSVVWRFALCWVAGFIVPGAPAGLGVREALFTKLFSPELGEGGAACVALVFRVLTTVGDLLTFTIAWWLGQRVLTPTDDNNMSA